MLNNFLKRLMTAICLLIFLHIKATWLLKLSRSSVCTPSNLQVVEGCINVPSTEKLTFSSSVWLCLEFVLLKINDSHFSGFSRRPLSVIQLETTANSEFRVDREDKCFFSGPIWQLPSTPMHMILQEIAFSPISKVFFYFLAVHVSRYTVTRASLTGRTDNQSDSFNSRPNVY